MSPDRVFLGWDRPFLPLAVRELARRYGSDGLLNLSPVLVVVPGARVQRRLLELLADQAASPEGRALLLPPRVITMGELPEELITRGSDDLLPPADELCRLLARIESLREAPADCLGRITPHIPDRAELAAWIALAEDIDRIHVELAAEGIRFAEVAAHCRRMDGEFCDAERWEALFALHEGYLAVLAREKLSDRFESRLQALAAQEAPYAGEIVLLGTMDLPRVSRELLRRARGRIIALIHAPDEVQDGFDELGTLLVDEWTDRPIPLRDDRLRFVDRPRDQARTVLEAIRALGGLCAAEEITVGMGDEGLAPLLARTLELAGLPARPAVGRSLLLSRPAVLLAAVADYLEDGRSDRFAAILRHPDLEGWLIAVPGARDATIGNSRHEWLSLLDRYTGEHLPLHLGRFWAETRRDFGALRAVFEAVESLLKPLARRMLPLRSWAAEISALLSAVYGTRALRRRDPHDEPLLDALEEIGDALREVARIPAGSPLSPEVPAAAAIRFLLGRLSGRYLPHEERPCAIQLLGWLELPLDDAPVVIVTGVNEGRVPESVNADAFLPDRLRRELGLLDNRRRYARDALALRMLVESRELTLISGRRSSAGEPLTPSRLLFACDETTLVRRALAFYQEGDGGALPPSPLPSGERSRFVVPRPRSVARPFTELPVTAFRAYLACPYRFYLRYVLQLDALDDSLIELDGRLFGNLLHDALCRFARGPVRDSEDAGEIEAALVEILDALVLARFGAERSPAVEIQLYQARRRLRELAKWQAQAAQEGWRIARVEADGVAQVVVDGEPFTIRGRIDRIDTHPELGCRLLDYKTGDSLRKPEQVHRAGQPREWVDLQLPLYRHLARAMGVEGTVQLGYLCLPKDLKQVGLQEAEWSPEELQAADERMAAVVRGVRAETYWPPSEIVPSYPDAYSGICLDRCVDRRSLQQEVTG